MPLVDKLYLVMVIACFVGFLCVVMTLSLTDLRLDKKRSAARQPPASARNQDSAMAA